MLKAKKIVCLNKKLKNNNQNKQKNQNTKYIKHKHMKIETIDGEFDASKSCKFFVDELIENSKIKVKDKGHVKKVSSLPGYMMDMLVHKED